MISYLKYGALAALVAGLFGFGWYGGALQGRAAVARLERDQAQLTATAVLAERASWQTQSLSNHQAEIQHAAEIAQADDIAPIASPVIVVYRLTPTRDCPVPGGAIEARPLPAHPEAGGGEPVDRGRDIRPAVEAIKRRLEKLMADYRQIDAEWPAGASSAAAR